MTSTAYVEHVAIWVRDIQWHIRFFREALGMEMRDYHGAAESPAQYWTVGGLQLIHDPDHGEPEGRLAHLGIMCEDQEAAIAAARAFGAAETPQGRNWLRLPDGLLIELLQASVGAVAQARAVNPRAQA
jgi:catechol 2,3-dioxygenase-like lactoylglutathione lyase family enzyme